MRAGEGDVRVRVGLSAKLELCAHTHTHQLPTHTHTHTQKICEAQHKRIQEMLSIYTGTRLCARKRQDNRPPAHIHLLGSNISLNSLLPRPTWKVCVGSSCRSTSRPKTAWARIETSLTRLTRVASSLSKSFPYDASQSATLTSSLSSSSQTSSMKLRGPRQH